MKRVEITYLPYTMSTKVLIDGKDVISDFYNTSYTNFRNIIGTDFKTPLQTWIDPIPYKGWKGLLEEIGDPERNAEIEIVFSGREIDFNDLKRALDNQNEKRNSRIRNKISYVHKEKIDDKQVAEKIEYVVNEMKSERFQRLVAERESLKKFYAELEGNYKKTKEKEFDIVFAGLYSSGKSTLINTLIRHEILPVASKTCTNMVCKIHHDNDLGRCIDMHFHNGNGKIEKRKFDSDIECANCFEKIAERVKETAEKDIQEGKTPLEYRMDIYVDLSHLYPSTVNKKDFSIVLIDTPGMDSTDSITSDGLNQHAQIALDAISMDTKPMIILCAEATKYEDKNIGEFMRSILLESGEEHGGFNDRFLFLLNKCDAVKFGKGESIEKAKERFSKYLTDAKKWGIALDDEEKEQLKNASYFIPRIFMVTARIASAIQNRVFELSREELKKNADMRKLYKDLEDYKEEVNDWNNENNMLLNYCDIPEYRKRKFEEKFSSAKEKGNDIEATKIQCGVLAVESAIRDYIERYAYPIKVQELFNTFKNILMDVVDWNEETVKKLEDCEKKRNKKEDEKNYQLEKNEEKKEEEKKFKKAREKVESYNSCLEQIDSDFCLDELKKIINKFQKNISAKPQIREVTEKSVIETYGKTEYEIRLEILNKIEKINNIYMEELDNFEIEMRQFEQKYDDKMKKILDGLSSILIELKESEVFKNRDYDFTNSIWWEMQLTKQVIDPKLVDKMNIEKRKDIEKEVVDEKKQKLTSWIPEKWKIRKNIERIFKIVEIKSEIIPGHYETEEIVMTISNYNKKLDQIAKKLAENLAGNLNMKKEENRRLLNDMLYALNYFHKDINSREEKINSLRNEKKKLEAEIEKCKADQLWLGGLYEKIERIVAYE